MSRLPRISPDDLRSSHADDARVERIWQRVQPELPVRLRRPRSIGRAVLLAAAAFSVFGIGLAVGRSSLETEVETAVVRAPNDAPMADVFAAGSTARSFMLPRGAKLSLEPSSLVELVEVSDGSITLTLLQGNASVDATTAEGSFFVVAGEARVSAPAGSSMSLARGESDIDVVVASGAVEVFSPAGRHLVKRGQALAHVPTLTKVSERGDIEPAEEPVRVAMVPARRDHGIAAQRLPNDPSPASPSDPVVAPAVEPAAQSWLALVGSNKYDEALEVIEKGPGLEATIKNAQSAAELMALSDIAGSKRPALRIRALHRVADDFASDPSAPAAAFYLSRIYESSDKALAAKYREKTKQAAALNELAICSELKSISTSTDAELAIAVQKATEYLATYPKGSCVEDANSILEDSVSKPKREPEKKTEPEKKPEEKKAEDKKADEKKAEPHPAGSASQAPGSAPAPSAKSSAQPPAAQPPKP